ncbi:hypothetical protein VKT23_017890 [Stygiomarasmius scandens]|uniref:Uncharacterized protein n=1 Tax=Marasmiellus scandens TaxID=2682957 RepID=A0ABR1ITT0_9AGAR
MSKDQTGSGESTNAEGIGKRKPKASLRVADVANTATPANNAHRTMRKEAMESAAEKKRKREAEGV